MTIRVLVASLAAVVTGLVLSFVPSSQPGPASEVCFGALQTVACVPPQA